MSRIGKLPVDLPAGVTVTVGADNVVRVKGPLGELTQKVDPDIKVQVEGNAVHVTRPTDQPRPPLDARTLSCVDPQHGCRRIERL